MQGLFRESGCVPFNRFQSNACPLRLKLSSIGNFIMPNFQYSPYLSPLHFHIRSLFCSVDTIANILIFFPRIFRPEDDKKGRISGLTNPITGSHKASVGRQGTMETSDVSHKAINKHSVPGQVQDVRGGHKLSTQISDLPTDQTDGHHVEKLRKSGVDEISAEEEKDEEDSSTVRFRMKDQLIVLPKWVLEEYGTMESIDLCEGEPVTKAEGMPSEV